VRKLAQRCGCGGDTPAASDRGGCSALVCPWRSWARSTAPPRCFGANLALVVTVVAVAGFIWIGLARGMGYRPSAAGDLGTTELVHFSWRAPQDLLDQDGHIHLCDRPVPDGNHHRGPDRALTQVHSYDARAGVSKPSAPPVAARQPPRRHHRHHRPHTPSAAHRPASAPPRREPHLQPQRRPHQPQVLQRHRR